MKTLLFVDFDYTLFNAALLKRDLFAVFHGHSEAAVTQSYYEVCQIQAYHPHNHVDYLEKDSIKAQEMKESIHVLLKHAKNYLYPDSVAFLEGVDRERYDIQLLTYGNPDFQSEKVRNCGIEHLFSECHYTPRSKELYLKEYLPLDKAFIVIDDTLEALEKIEKTFPQEVSIFLDRHGKNPGYESKRGQRATQLAGLELPQL